MRIGIDIGGSHISCALINNSGNIVKLTNKFSKNRWKLSEIGAVINRLVDNLTHSLNEINSIGIGVPGAVNAKTGYVYYSANLPFKKINLKDFFEDKLSKKVKIENDANCAALGEMLFGNGINKSNIVLITIGTGIGSGIILNKKIFSGHNGFAGEVGHQIIVANGKECACGNKGCFEAYASMIELEGRAKKIIKHYPNSILSTKNISGKSIYDSAKLGDPFSNELVKEHIFYLGIGIANIINILQPEVVLISGAISRQKDFLLSKLKPSIDKNLYVQGTYELKTSKLEDKAGLIGAAFL